MENVDSTTSRAAHLQRCKDRALAELNAGSIANCWASMCSDMRKHPGTKGHVALDLGMMLLLGGLLSTDSKMRDFINGFN